MNIQATVIFRIYVEMLIVAAFRIDPTGIRTPVYCVW